MMTRRQGQRHAWLLGVVILLLGVMDAAGCGHDVGAEPAEVGAGPQTQALSVAGATGYDYWPLAPGSWIKYKVFAITAAWHDDSYKLDVTSRRLVGEQTIMAEAATCPDCFGSNPIWKEQFWVNGHATGALQEGGGKLDGKSYLGEAVGRSGQVAVPFLAKLTRYPVAGEILSATSSIKESCEVCSEYMKWSWSYKTIGHLPAWGAFRDVWRTGLKELPVDGKNSYYNYVFMRGVGLVNFWYLHTASGAAYEYYAVDWGAP